MRKPDVVDGGKNKGSVYLLGHAYFAVSSELGESGWPGKTIAESPETLRGTRIIQNSHVREREQREERILCVRPLNEFFITTQLYEIFREKQFRTVRI